MRAFKWVIAIVFASLLLQGCFDPVMPRSDKKENCFVTSGGRGIRNADLYVLCGSPEYFGRSDSTFFNYRHIRTKFKGLMYIMKPAFFDGSSFFRRYTMFVGAENCAPMLLNFDSANLPGEIKLLPSENPLEDLRILQKDLLKRFQSSSDDIIKSEALSGLVLIYFQTGQDILPLLSDTINTKSEICRMQAVSLLGWLGQVHIDRSAKKTPKEKYETPEIMQYINLLVKCTSGQSYSVSAAAFDQLSLISYRRFNTPEETEKWWAKYKTLPRKQWMLDGLDNNTDPKLKFRAAADLESTGDDLHRGAHIIANAKKSPNLQERKWADFEYKRIKHKIKLCKGL